MTPGRRAPDTGSVEAHSLPGEPFAVPADFKRLEMPAIPGLGGMIPCGGKQDCLAAGNGWAAPPQPVV